MLKPTKHATTNFKMLKPFLDEVDRCDGHMVLEAAGFMPLSFDLLGHDDAGRTVYGMMHFYTQNGDLMRDPDMTFAVDREVGTVEPLTYQQDGLPGAIAYQQVYSADGKTYKPRLRTDLDAFLWQWLQNIQAQKFDPMRKKVDN